MKKITRTYFVIVLALMMTACASDELSKAKVIELLEEHESEVPVKDWIFFYEGDRVNLDNVEIPLFERLRDEGFLTFSPSKNGFFNIQLTEEGKKHTVDTEKYEIREYASLANREGSWAVFVHTFFYRPISVEEIRVAPQLDEAEATVSYSVVGRTPFAVLANEETGTTIKRYFKSTTDGWKFER